MPKLPPPVSAARRKVVCYMFGSVDGTVNRIADEFDRTRCVARLNFEAARATLWVERTFRNYHSPDDTLAGIPTAAARKRALTFVTNGAAETDAFCIEALKYPALIRARGASELLQPFDEED